MIIQFILLLYMLWMSNVLLLVILCLFELLFTDHYELVSRAGELEIFAFQKVIFSRRNTVLQYVSPFYFYYISVL